MWSVHLGSHGFQDYEAIDNAQIEQAYQEGRSSALLAIKGTAYIVCFKKMIQYQQNNSHRFRHVRRSGGNAVWTADLGRHGFCEYDGAANYQIEQAYLENRSSATVMVNGKPYVVCFRTMKQYPKDNPGKCRSVRRSEGSSSMPTQLQQQVPAELKTRHFGTMTLCHLTTEDAARSIVASKQFRNSQAKGAYRPMFGEFIYFASRPEDCEGKARAAQTLADGALLKADVALGTVLVCGDAPPPPVQAYLQISRWSDLTESKLQKANCQSVQGTQPLVSRDEYAVPSTRQVSKIRVSRYKDAQSQEKPWWLWPQWVHDLALAIGVDDNDIELTAQNFSSSHFVPQSSLSTVNGVRFNCAGRPIHDNGRFMSYAEARSKGWSGPDRITQHGPGNSNNSGHRANSKHHSPSNHTPSQRSQSQSAITRKPNAWNDFQHQMRGQGLSRYDMLSAYATQRASQGVQSSSSSSGAPRRPNAWNEFQHQMGGIGLSRQGMLSAYHTHIASVGGAGVTGSGAYSSAAGGGSSGGGGLGWNAFQASVGGQGFSKAQISAMYHAQK